MLKYGSIKVSPFKAPTRLIRSVITKNKFFDHIGVSFNKDGKKVIRHLDGYQTRLASYRDKFAGKRCFILGNGPSLNKMDLRPLANEITMGANGIFHNFDRLGFTADFVFFQDNEQTFLRRKEINRFHDSVKIAGLNNAYFVKRDKGTLFFNPRHDFQEGKVPRFSYEFPSVVFLGGTVSYVMMQWAYFLGCTEVYVLGIDHNYGELPNLFPPGKIKITEENIHLVKGLHVDTNYYKVGDVIGVPDVSIQDRAYQNANTAFMKAGRKICNAGVDSKLAAFEQVGFESLF
jgi:hypothetical protein